jgi:glyoxylase I family protein
MGTPSFSKVSHISFSARDAEASADWWRRVFEFEDLDRVAGDGWKAVLLIHPATVTIIEFQQHDANQGETFDPARTGFDHMGLKVDTVDELERWQRRFEELGVVHTPIVHRAYGSVLTFKDPDGIQFEMFFRDGHP